MQLAHDASVRVFSGGAPFEAGGLIRRCLGRVLDGFGQTGGVEGETVADRLTQGLADPLIQAQGQVLVQRRVAGQGGAQSGQLARMIDQISECGGFDPGAAVCGQRRHDGRVAARDDSAGHRGADVGTQGDLNLMFDRTVGQKLNQIVVEQQGAGGDHGAGDLNLVGGQHPHQGGGRPFHLGQPLGQDLTDFTLGAAGQGDEDVG